MITHVLLCLFSLFSFKVQTGCFKNDKKYSKQSSLKNIYTYCFHPFKLGTFHTHNVAMTASSKFTQCVGMIESHDLICS